MRPWPTRWMVMLFAATVAACSPEKETPAVGHLAPDWNPGSTIAWSVDMHFSPTGTAIRGIPIEELDPNWSRASELTKESIPKQVYLDSYGASTAPFETFSLSGDFNKDGIEDLVVAGVYDGRSGEGGFILVLTRTAGGGWKKVFLWEILSSGGNYLALDRDTDKIVIKFAPEGDFFPKLVWNSAMSIYEVEGPDD